MSEATRRWGVPRRTLQHRLTGTISHCNAVEIQMRLTPIQENYLITWIKQLDGEFNNPPHALIIRMAKKIANIPLGQRWLTKFKARHPKIGTLKEKKTTIKGLMELKKSG